MGLSRPSVVQKECTGHPGGPRTVIDEEFLHEALSSQRKINVAQLACALDVSQPTIYSNMKEYGITQAYSKLSDPKLNEFLLHYKLLCPTAGLQFVMVHLRSVGHRV
jgi:hypothetical protein